MFSIGHFADLDIALTFSCVHTEPDRTVLGGGKYQGTDQLTVFLVRRLFVLSYKTFDVLNLAVQP